MIESNPLAALVLVIAATPASAKSAEPFPCRAVSFVANVTDGVAFERRISPDLVLRLVDWRVTLTPTGAPDVDYIYPVNPPIRFNPMQDFGAGYGLSAKQSMQMPRELRFVTGKKDYDRIDPKLIGALWPYDAPRPKTASADYLSTLKSLTTGALKITALDYELDSTREEVLRARFSVELTAPVAIGFLPELHPKPASCPAKQDTLSD